MLHRDAPTLVIPTCYWWTDAETGEHIIIPGCWARAVDANDCTCRIPASQIEEVEERLAAAERTNERLRQSLDSAFQNRSDLRQTIRHLWAVMRNHGVDPSQHPEPETDET